MSNTLKCFSCLIIYLIAFALIPKSNNVCKTFIDYYFPEGNENCYHDPDYLLKTPELIQKYAGAVETHEVTTEDGYILTMFRIPRKNSKGVVLLHHSIATYSRIYLFQGHDSLAINLWRNGFDVWLANQRGTSYSDRHVNMTKHDFRYWNFCVDEMASYDVTSELKLIREKTNGSKVTYFGHSLGAAIGLVYACLKPEEAKYYLKDMIVLSPPTQFNFASISTIFLQYLFRYSESITHFIQIGSVSLSPPALVALSKIALRTLPPIQYTVGIFLWIFCGLTPQETDPTFFSFDSAVYGNNFSFKTMIHFSQVTNLARKYDYGTEGNLKLYGNSTPPAYPIENISIPVLFISSFHDALISVEDSEGTFGRLSPVAATYGHWKYSGLNHLDFLVGLHRKEIFVDKLIKFLIKMS